MTSLPSRLRIAFAALAVAVLAAACGAKNPNFCEGDSCTEVDASIDAAPVTCTGTGGDPTCPATTPVCESGSCTGMCTADTDCAGRAASEAVCLTSTGACVQCDETNTQATPGQPEDECPAPAMAVCDGDTHTCRACEAHSECFSGVCDAGTCVVQANVIYLVPAADGGTDGGMNECLSASTGCLTLNHAISKLTATRKYILFKPSATPYPVRNNTDRADFNGDTAYVIGYGASLDRNGDGELIEVRGATANVTIEGLEMSGATGIATGAGIKLSDGTLTLFRAKIINNLYRGIQSGGGNLRVRRSLISNNEAGGIAFDGSSIVLVNNFIVGNGDMTTSTIGGAQLNLTGTGSVIEFNTIAQNAAAAATAHGIACGSPGGAFTARNNIIMSEQNRPQVSGTCLHEYTLFGGPGTAPVGGTGNMTITDVAMFMFASATDYHLLTGSVAAAKAQSTPLTGDSLFDVDGDARALGSATLDVGADEIP